MQKWWILVYVVLLLKEQTERKGKKGKKQTLWKNVFSCNYFWSEITNNLYLLPSIFLFKSPILEKCWSAVRSMYCSMLFSGFAIEDCWDSVSFKRYWLMDSLSNGRGHTGFHRNTQCFPICQYWFLHCLSLGIIHKGSSNYFSLKEEKSFIHINLPFPIC